jgi:hypothetical protein
MYASVPAISSGGSGDPNAQKLRYSRWAAGLKIEGIATWVLEHQRRAVAMQGKFDWARSPGGIKPKRGVEVDQIRA